eukprot:4212447-Amphidinium_carterae.1
MQTVMSCCARDYMHAQSTVAGTLPRGQWHPWRCNVVMLMDMLQQQGSLCPDLADKGELIVAHPGC